MRIVSVRYMEKEHLEIDNDDPFYRRLSCWLYLSISDDEDYLKVKCTIILPRDVSASVRVTNDKNMISRLVSTQHFSPCTWHILGSPHISTRTSARSWKELGSLILFDSSFILCDISPWHSVFWQNPSSVGRQEKIIYCLDDFSFHPSPSSFQRSTNRNSFQIKFVSLSVYRNLHRQIFELMRIVSCLPFSIDRSRWHCHISSYHTTQLTSYFSWHSDIKEVCAILCVDFSLSSYICQYGHVFTTLFQNT